MLPILTTGAGFRNHPQYQMRHPRKYPHHIAIVSPCFLVLYHQKWDTQLPHVPTCGLPRVGSKAHELVPYIYHKSRFFDLLVNFANVTNYVSHHVTSPASICCCHFSSQLFWRRCTSAGSSSLKVSSLSGEVPPISIGTGPTEMGQKTIENWDMVDV